MATTPAEAAGGMGPPGPAEAVDSVERAELVDGQLHLAGRGLEGLPGWMVERFRPCRVLDLSCNRIATLHGLDRFPGVEEVVLDDNNLADLSTLPPIPTLRVLSLNKNPLRDFQGTLRMLRQQTPNLTFLSLCFTDICPSELSGCSPVEYQGYRRIVTCYLPGLQFLDSRRVRDGERKAALSMGPPDLRTVSSLMEEAEAQLQASAGEVDLGGASSLATGFEDDVGDPGLIDEHAAGELLARPVSRADEDTPDTHRAAEQDSVPGAGPSAEADQRTRESNRLSVLHTNVEQLEARVARLPGPGGDLASPITDEERWQRVGSDRQLSVYLEGPAQANEAMGRGAERASDLIFAALHEDEELPKAAIPKVEDTTEVAEPPACAQPVVEAPAAAGPAPGPPAKWQRELASASLRAYTLFLVDTCFGPGQSRVFLPDQAASAGNRWDALSDADREAALAQAKQHNFSYTLAMRSLNLQSREPLSPYMHFGVAIRAPLTKRFPLLPGPKLAATMNELWEALGDSGRAAFDALGEADAKSFYRHHHPNETLWSAFGLSCQAPSLDNRSH